MKALSALTLILLPGAPLLAQSPGIGPFLPLNAYTTANQLQPSLAPDGSGGFIAVWESFGQDGSGRGAFGRRFDANGAPVGGEFQANSYTTGDQRLPQVACDSTGAFVVVWEGQRVGDDTQGIALRVYDSTGAPIFPGEREAHPGTLDPETLPRVARNDNGFVVVWHHLAPIVGNELIGQRFDPDGDTIASTFQVAAFTTGAIAAPAVAMDAAGNFVVAWQSYDDGNATGIRARAFDPDGLPITGEFNVNTYTTGFQTQPSVAMNGTGGFVIAWDNGYATDIPIHARRYDADAQPLGNQVLIGNGLGPVIAKRDLGGYGAIWVPASGQTVEFALIEGARFDDTLAPIGPPFVLHDPEITQAAFARTVAANNGRHLVFAWQDFGPGGNLDIFARRGGFPDGAPFQVDTRAPTGGTSNVNGVLEVGERVMVDQAYMNLSGAPYPLAGTASNWTGPAGLSFTIHDAAADYGTIPGAAASGQAPNGAATADCFTATGNCFEFELTGTRTPGLHWDATYDEALSEGVSVTRTLHIGGSFNDVPGTNLFFRFIENLFHNGITAGGPCGGYCPTDGVKRQQMAVFLLKSKNGAAYVPPQPTGTIFADVPISHPFGGWIEDLYNQGVTGGCATNPLRFCPDNIVNRQQMAVFLLKMKEGSAYDPPDCAGIFADVSCTPGAGFSDWIEELYNRQITGGCATNPLQYCPTNPVTRGQMSAFLVKNFGLVLYGP
jgi:hypothetical protein